MPIKVLKIGDFSASQKNGLKLAYVLNTGAFYSTLNPTRGISLTKRRDKIVKLERSRIHTFSI